MRILLVVNTSASAVTARARVVIAKALSADHTVTVTETSRRGHATRLAQGAAADGLDAVVVLGGDGTLNEAANGLAESTTALGVLPGGSTNVFARTIGMTNDPIEATGELLGAMARDSRLRIGLGSVNGRYFLFHAGAGYDAAVVKEVERRGALKRYVSDPLFVWAAVTTWFRHYDRGRPRFSVTLGRPGENENPVDATFAVVQNSDPYTFLGNRPLTLSHSAGLDSPLTAVVFRRLRAATLLRALGAALGSSGRLPASRGVVQRAGLTELTITGIGPFPYQLDGDYLGEAESLSIRYEPACLDLYVP